MEEIVVTARWRTEDVQDVPVAVTAISGETLRNVGQPRMYGIGATYRFGG